MALARFRGSWCGLGPVALLAAAVAVWPETLLPARAQDAPEKGAVLIVDANSGRALLQSAADAPRRPASLAKLMTLYLVFERIDHGRLSYQTPIRFSANAVAAAPSKLDVPEGTEIALIDAIKVLITKSANDVAVAIAERIAGSEANFARLMTQKAHHLGMSATTFRNASGLPDEEQVTSARDLITLTLHLEDDFPRYYPLFATRYLTYHGETFRNHNSLLFDFPGTDGLKTGYTHASGFNLVASVRRGRKHVVGVIFGGTSAASRDRAMESYLLRALAQASNERTRSTVPVRVARGTPRGEHAPLLPPAPQRVTRAAAAPPAITSATPRAPGAAASPAIAAAAASPAVADANAASGVALPRVRQVLLEHAVATAAQPEGIAGLLAQDGGAGASAGARINGPEAAPALMTARATDAANASPVLLSAAQSAPPPGPNAAAPAASPREGETTSARASAADAAGGFLIQIGAYNSQAEAERQLARARTRAPRLLDARAPMTQPVTQGDRQLFRARYGGFAAAAGAAQACQALLRQGIACLVVKGQ